ncbi:hypothetical protein R1sor_015521 [Riccia sorocarpa]|uniref:AB hydrolase-1 domain-containing protein n=1 Tax=Riccia sorocarpa TaxID=122646 RepID=A0ABD3HF61_9MARC
MASHKDYGVKTISLGQLYDFQSCEKEKEKIILLFIHGIALDEQRGADEIPFKTWTFEGSGTESKICWPSKLNDLFKEDEEMEEERDDMVVRTLTVAYDACKVMTHNTGRLDLYLLAEKFSHCVIPKLVRKGKKIPIILVAHSFGGFVIQELIDKAFKATRSTAGYTPQKQFFENLEGIFFYSTPFQALLKSTYFHFFPEVDKEGVTVTYSELVKLLKEQNKELSRDTTSFARNIEAISRDYRGGKPIKIRAVFEENETVMENWTGKIVEEASARYIPGHENPVSLPHDHFRVCKLFVRTNEETKKLEFEDSVFDLRYTLL